MEEYAQDQPILNILIRQKLLRVLAFKVIDASLELE